MRQLLFALLMFAALPARAADDGQVSFLMQEVRNLQRQMQVLSSQVNELRNQPSRLAAQSTAPRAQPASADAKWLDSAKWRGLRKGMSELEVISALGPPTSMRIENGSCVLLYAMEIGSSGFLGGSVTVLDREVTEVRQPTLQ